MSGLRRSLTTFMAGVPHLEKQMTLPDEQIDIEMEIEVPQLHLL